MGGGHHRDTPEPLYHLEDALIIGGDQHTSHTCRLGGALVDPLDHRFASDIYESLTGETTRGVARGNNGDDLFTLDLRGHTPCRLRGGGVACNSARVPQGRTIVHTCFSLGFWNYSTPVARSSNSFSIRHTQDLEELGEDLLRIDFQVLPQRLDGRNMIDIAPAEAHTTL
jgi:hypothetical protein